MSCIVNCVWPTCSKLVQGAALGKTRISGRQGLPQVDDAMSVELDDTDCNQLRKQAEGKDNRSLSREEGFQAESKGRACSVVSTEQMGPKAMETSKNFPVDGGDSGVLSQGRTEARDKSKTGVKQKPKGGDCIWWQAPKKRNPRSGSSHRSGHEKLGSKR